MPAFSIIADHAQRIPNKPALLAFGRESIDYLHLYKQITQVASLLSNMGIGSADRIIIIFPNGPELALITLGVMGAAVAVPANPDYREAEYLAMFGQIKPRLLITLAGIDHASKRAAVSAGLKILEVEIFPHSPVVELNFVGVNSPITQDQSLSPVLLDSVALILQTSGTTSSPKLVPLTHANLLESSRNIQRSLRLISDDCVLHFLPMFHIGGVVDVLLAPLIAGSSVVCCKTFSAPDFFRDLLYFKPTWVQAVPVMTEEIISVKDHYHSIISQHTLRFLRSVSAPLSTSLMREFEDVFNIPVIEIFGMTESSGVITSNPLPPGIRKPGSVGISVGSKVKIIDETGRTLLPNELGQVAVQGANLMHGYEDESDANVEVMKNGVFRTGDIGYLDSEGYLFLVGRIKDVINRGGEKISPAEVDRTLMAHQSVADAACFAVPHPSLGEDLAAIIVVKKDHSFNYDLLLSYLRERLAFFKVPRYIKVVDQIPRVNGKLQRTKLAELFTPSLDLGLSVKADYIAPRSPVEKIIADAWRDILKIQPIGINDNFFEIGGDSLKAASFINALQQQWGETIYVSSIFDAPTIASYASYLSQHYQELYAKILGESLTFSYDKDTPITAEIVEEFRATIAHPVPRHQPAAQKNQRAIFVLSAPRSGSTLLRVMLAGNPKVFSPPELYLLSFDTMADRKSWYSGSQRFQLEGNIRALMELRNQTLDQAQKFVKELEDANVPVQEYYRMLQDWLGDRILADKTPAYAIDIETLKRAEEYFEEPYYINLVRHPYGMIRSFEEAKLEQLWYPRLVGGDKTSRLDALPYNRRQLAEMIWLILNKNILEFLRDIPLQRQIFLRFEDLVNQPEKKMREVCEKIGITYASGMVNPQQEKKNRMTDGIHESSRMIGDPKFHKHNKIDSAIADQWKFAFKVDFLSEESLQLARDFGYSETIATVLQRTELDL